MSTVSNMRWLYGDVLLSWCAEPRKQTGSLLCGAEIAKVVGPAGPCENLLQDNCAIWSKPGSKYGVVQRHTKKELTVLDVTHGQQHSPRCKTVGDMLESEEVFQITMDILDCLDEKRWPISPVKGTAYAMANTGGYESRSDNDVDCHGHMHVGEDATYEQLVNDTIMVAQQTGLFDAMTLEDADKLKQRARAKAIKTDLDAIKH